MENPAIPFLIVFPSVLVFMILLIIFTIRFNRKRSQDIDKWFKDVYLNDLNEHEVRRQYSNIERIIKEEWRNHSMMHFNKYVKIEEESYKTNPLLINTISRILDRIKMRGDFIPYEIRDYHNFKDFCFNIINNIN